MRRLGILHAERGSTGDIDKALRYLDRAIAAGDGVSAMIAGDLLRAGNPSRLDLARAAGYYARALVLDVKGAGLKLGDLYIAGMGVPVDMVRGLSLITAAADAGERRAQKRLGDLYSKGPIPLDGAKALEYYLKAADNGEALALLRIGEIHRDGRLVPADAAKAAAFFAKAADAGVAAAKFRLGDLHIDGAGVPMDVARGVSLIAEAADAGERAAQRRLGDLYSRGPIRIDMAKALAYYGAAARGGDAMAHLRIGDILRSGLLVPADLPGAVARYRAAADLGLPIAKARLGEAYIRGQGVTADVEKGLGLIRQAAAADLAVQKILGDLVSRGDYIPPDAAAAVDLYRRSGDAGNARAYLRLGEIFRDGSIVARDGRQALDYFRKAAGLGLIEAEIAIARGHLRMEFGRFSDRRAGLKQLLVLADAGNAPAAGILADAYYWGNGVAKDPPKALRILDRASKAGSVEATRKLIAFYRDAPGGRMSRSLKKARALLAARGDQFGPGPLAREQVLISAAEADGARDYAAIAERVRGVVPVLQFETLLTLKNTNPNAFIFIAQTEMKRRALYDGPADGRLTASTIASLNRLCAGSASGGKCRKGPLDTEAARVIAIMIDPSRDI